MKNVFLILIIALTTSCASRQGVINTRLKQLATTLNPLLSKSEDDTIKALGVPDSITEAGSFKIYRYKKSFGMKGGYHQNVNLFTGQPMPGGQTTTWESYDQYDLFFKDGVLDNYRTYVSR